MKVKWVVAWLAVLAGLVLCCAAAWAGEVKEKKPWQGRLADGTVIGEKELAEIVRLNKLWWDSEEKEGERADLNGADLSGASLSRANLSGANLTWADLSEANLSGANLREATLEGAKMHGASLLWAYLRGADLTRADLRKAWLSGATLYGANLSKAELSEANLLFTDLAGAIFQPDTYPPKDDKGQPTGQPWWPDLQGFANAYNLWQLVYIENPQPLTALRDKLKQDGFLHTAHQLTHALRHNKGGVGLDSHIAYYLVAWPTEWGLSPLRPLVLLLVPAAFSFVLYFISLSLAGGKDGIWREWLPDRMRQDQGRKKPERLMPRHIWPRLGFAFYFSLLSAFHIGLKSMALGTWINRVHPREYTLRATGWVRVVSGVQSLISVYLLALAVLTYFGRPFE